MLFNIYNKTLLPFFIMVMAIQAGIAQIDISEARQKAVGTTVTVQGVVTNGDELGPIRYMQDGTAGIPVYSPGDFSDAVNPGDIVLVTGTLKDYNNLLEIDPLDSYEIISTGNPLPAPIVASPSELGEDLESQLVQINGIKFAAGGQTFTVDEYEFEANGATGQVYIRTGHPLLGTTIPLARLNLTGIVSQFYSDYQVLPRGADDFQITDAFYITSIPVQSDISTSGFTVSWNTNTAGNTVLKYGTTTDLENEIRIDEQVTAHAVALDGLQAASFYYVQAISESNGNEARSAVRYFSTASGSSGVMEVYFNHPVDPSFASGNAAPGSTSGAAIEAAIIEKINNAVSTIDICMYNNNREPIVAALTAAHERGVIVRYITNIGSFNSALSNPKPPFPVLAGNAEALMHNKYLVMDRESVDNSWVVTGSMNFTQQNIADDYNNMVFIQDQALAKAYTVEFEEMWGSPDPTPGIFGARFGDNKTDNTPHQFLIGNMSVESYFSPSDNTTIAIENALRTADTDLQFALLSFTRNELGTAILDESQEGTYVRGIIENTSDQGSEYDFLLSNGVNVTGHPLDNSIHHKYAIIDATNPASDPTVITGSHNWSTSAEVRNDENTLVIHSEVVSNIFLQEFELRWCEIMNPGNCITSSVFNPDRQTQINWQLIPNPAYNNTLVQLNEELSGEIVLKVLTENGRLIKAVVVGDGQFQNYNVSLTGLPAGNYFIEISSAQKRSIKRLVKQ